MRRLALLLFLLAVLAPHRAAAISVPVQCGAGVDTAPAINAALAAGNVPQLTAGVCRIASGILDQTSNTMLFGVGACNIVVPDPAHAGQTPVWLTAIPNPDPCTTILVATPGAYTAITITGTSGAPTGNVYMSGFTLDGGATALTKTIQNISVLRYAHDVVMDHVDLRRSSAGGFYCSGCVNTTLENSFVTLSEGNGVYGNNSGTQFSNWYSILNNVVQDNSQSIPPYVEPTTGPKVPTYDGIDHDGFFDDLTIAGNTVIDDDVLTDCHHASASSTLLCMWVVVAANVVTSPNVVAPFSGGSGGHNINGFIYGAVDNGNLYIHNMNYNFTQTGAVSNDFVINDTMNNSPAQGIRVSFTNADDPLLSSGTGQGILIYGNSIPCSALRQSEGNLGVTINGTAQTTLADNTACGLADYGLTDAGTSFRAFGNN